MPQFDHYQLQQVYQTVEHHLERKLQHETLQITFDTFDELQYVLHTLKIICQKGCFSSIFSIKMATQKLTNVDFV